MNLKQVALQYFLLLNVARTRLTCADTFAQLKEKKKHGLMREMNHSL